MAVREYIGARYVPRLMGTWSPTTIYEALDVVDDGLGTTYTARKPVPAGTPLTDTNYWVITGSVNGAIISLQNRVGALENIYATPEAFGAVGDGLTDDSAAFKNALLSGMSLYVPNKRYLITEHIDIPSDTIIFGEGVIIDRYDADADGHTNDNHVGCFNISNASNIQIIGIKFEGRGALSGQWNHGCQIYIGQSANVNISNCEFYNVDKAYAIAYDTSDTGVVDSCYVHQYTYSGIMCLNSSKNIQVVNNRVYDCKGKTANHCYPISLGGYDYPVTGVVPEAENNSAINNVVENLFPWWEGIESHGGINIRIIGNVIKNCYCGVAIVGYTGGYYTPTDVIIADNICYGPGAVGDVENFQNGGVNITRAKNVVITGNKFSGWGALGSTNPYSMRIANSENVTITGNTLINNGGASTVGLFYLSGKDIKVSDNIILDNTCVQVFDFVGAVTNIVVSHNMVRRSGTRLAYGGNATNQADAPLLNYCQGNDADNKTCSQFLGVYVPEDIVPAVIANLTNGRINDIVYNRTPNLANTPMGWICTVSEVDASTPATWKPLANIQ